VLTKKDRDKTQSYGEREREREREREKMTNKRQIQSDKMIEAASKVDLHASD